MNKYFREPMNGLTHFIGIIFAIFALLLLLNRTMPPLTIWHTVSFSIFGAGMILLYSASTLYHWLPLSDERLEVFRKIDHVMIFVFIAASYTPMCLVTLRGGWGWTMIGVVWAITVAGLFMKIFWVNAPRKLYTVIYLVMGWIIVIGVWPISQVMDFTGLLWLFAGGFFYSVGAVIYAIKKPNPFPGFFGFHETFHLFILAGSFAHFWMVYKFI
jgi:hemolysin III